MWKTQRTWTDHNCDGKENMEVGILHANEASEEHGRDEGRVVMTQKCLKIV
jgi:hypothetical protein